MASAITVENLSKRYNIGQSPRDTMIREALVGLLKRGRKPAEAEAFWALKNVSFTVGQGEVVGIIGRNGAGKSTLLKVLSRIIYPTSGTVEVEGRVTSLLEVGTGFHEELTGRENIYLNGSILGMKKREINEKIDAIVDFAGVPRFIDTRIKFWRDRGELDHLGNALEAGVCRRCTFGHRGAHGRRSVGGGRRRLSEEMPAKDGDSTKCRKNGLVCLS